MVLLRTNSLIFRIGNMLDRGNVLQFYSPKSNILLREYVFPPTLLEYKTRFKEHIISLMLTPSVNTRETIFTFDDTILESHGVMIKNHSRDATPMVRNKFLYLYKDGNLYVFPTNHLTVKKGKSIKAHKQTAISIPVTRGVSLDFSFTSPYDIVDIEEYINTIVLGPYYKEDIHEYRVLDYNQLQMALQEFGCKFYMPFI